MIEGNLTDPDAVSHDGWARAVLLAGAVAGVLDLLAAFALAAAAGAGPGQVLAAIASGLLGADAYGMGGTANLLGVVLHFAIMLMIAGVFVTGIRRLPALGRRPWLTGPVYGVAVYLVMQYLVLPLSAYPYAPAASLARIVPGIVVHMLCVGLPIALITRLVLRQPVPSGA